LNKLIDKTKSVRVTSLTQ